MKNVVRKVARDPFYWRFIGTPPIFSILIDFINYSVLSFVTNHESFGSFNFEDGRINLISDLLEARLGYFDGVVVDGSIE